MTVLLWLGLMIFWIVKLTKWDGKCPCKPGDCETCPYGQGSGFCKFEKDNRKGRHR